MASLLPAQPRLIIPSLACPFTTATHPMVEQIEQQALAWACRFGIIPNTHVLDQVQAARASWLLAWAYPGAPVVPLQIMADWNIWLLIWDDQCGAPGLADQPARLAHIHARFLAILRGAQLQPSDGPLEQGLHDLRERLLQHAPTAWLEQFVGRVADVFCSWEWEAANRARRVIPTVAQYLVMRRLTGALGPYLEFFALTNAVDLPPPTRHHATQRQLTRMANNIICWSNDVFSCAREYAQGEIHNLVFILHQQRQLSLQDALDCVARMHDAEVAAFQDLVSQLPSFGPADMVILRYILLLQSWIQANMNWAVISGRYANTIARSE